MNKKGVQMTFPWMFAIIVGATILFFTIYGIIKLVGTEETIKDVKTSKEIGILLNPLETGFEEARSTSLAFPSETRLYNLCSDFGYFGKQSFKVSQMSLNKWTETNIEVDFYNKYIFSEDIVEGKTLNAFSKKFEFPFKVTDLIYITSSDDIYCFDDAPEDVKNELENLNQNNLLTENCSSEHINVCFSGSCDIEVSYLGKFVEKNGEMLYFENDALMYGAIFSDKNIYECQLKRLMKRIVSLSGIYQDKAEFIRARGCESNIDLQALINLASNFKDSSELGLIKEFIEDIDNSNKYSSCKLW